LLNVSGRPPEHDTRENDLGFFTHCPTGTAQKTYCAAQEQNGYIVFLQQAHGYKTSFVNLSE
jgi:hypothetical protein